MSKGEEIEELLRNYFLKSGYYVIRGVPFSYEGFDVTDIDLWLYNRASPVSREITIVDAKNKKTPQAIERIFWTNGLKFACGATNAIVATTDNRRAVSHFGKELGVVVLDGAFLSRLKMPDANSIDRISDEELSNDIKSYSMQKLDGDWKRRLLLAKSLLAKPLTFDSCNQWLIDGKFFAELTITRPNQSVAATRCLYLICSFLAIGIDYLLREYSFIEQSDRTQIMTDGFTFGSRGKSGMDNLIDVASGLIRQHSNEGDRVSLEVKNNFYRALSDLDTRSLGEYFSRHETARSLFASAKEFESLAMARNLTDKSERSLECRSMLLCLVDFWGLDRTQFLGIK